MLLEKLKVILNELFYENNSLSLTRLIAFGGYLLFAIGSFYLLINNINWAGYDVFAGYTGGGGVALQFGNKFINSKYNSAPGSYAPNEPCCPPINRNPKM